MPTYRYVFKDLVTDETLDELELYGAYATRTINVAGQFNGTFRLGRGKVKDSLALAATRPGRTAVNMLRNDELIWGGIVWSRTYQSTGTTAQLYAQTYESYFDHMTFFDQHFIQQKQLQEEILYAIVTQLQTQVDSNIGLTLDHASLPTTGIKRTVLIPNYEYHFGIEAINQVVGVQLGLEYTIDPDKTVRVGYPLGNADSKTTYDYPGTITNYWMPESGANGGVKFATLGAGGGNKVLRSTAVNQDLIDDGYPGWWLVNQYPEIGDINTIKDKNRKEAETFKMPYRTPTFELKSDIGAGFDSWSDLGDMFHVHIEDKRYPNGTDIHSRMIGWELTPASGESPESIKFAIEGSNA